MANRVGEGSFPARGRLRSGPLPLQVYAIAVHPDGSLVATSDTSGPLGKRWEESHTFLDHGLCQFDKFVP